VTALDSSTDSPCPRGGTAARGLAIERRFPALAGRLARVPLTTLPTAVAPLAQLGRATGIEQLWIKRDDRSGAAYGGNKPRKLEFILGEALRRGCRTLLTFGTLGSHHALATAIAARHVELRTHLVLIPQPLTDHVRHQLLLDLAYGAELHYAATMPRAGLIAACLLVRETVRGRRPLVVGAGGSSALGTLGYVNAALELAEQVRAGLLPEPYAIFVALGSGGTVAGLQLGLELAGLASRVVAVRVTDLLPPTAASLRRLADAARRRLRRLDPALPAANPSVEAPTVLDGYLGRGYGAATPEAEAAQRRMADCEGVRLEGTYTGKCLAALLDVARSAPYRGRPVLFWNTFSSVDPTAGVPRLPTPRELPPAFRRFFADEGCVSVP
jgi:D-cysteine desulfhydrase